MNRRIFRSEAGQLKPHICGGEPITVPIGLTFVCSFSRHFFNGVGRSISDEDDLVDHLFSVD